MQATPIPHTPTADVPPLPQGWGCLLPGRGGPRELAERLMEPPRQKSWFYWESGGLQKQGRRRPGWRGARKRGWAVSGAGESCELDSDEGRERPLQPCTFTPKRCSCSPPGLAACMQRARCSYRRRLDRPGDGRVELGGQERALNSLRGWVDG